MSLAAIDFIRDRVERLPGASFCKWIGAAAMLVEHVSTHAFELWDAVWPQVFGSFAFPFFVASFCALAGPDASRWERLVLRLAFFAVLAQGVGYLVGREAQLNVLATFAMGTWAAHMWRANRWGLAAIAVAIGGVAEFSVAGTVAIAAGLLIFDDPRGGWMRYGAVMLAASLLPSWNPYAPPVIVWFGCVAAAVCLFLPITAPDRRGAFAFGYVAQWPLLRAIRDLRDVI